MPRKTNPLDGLVDEEGQLLDERKKLDLLQGSHTLLVPRDIQVIEHTGRLYLTYAVPEGWSADAPPVHRAVDAPTSAPIVLAASALWGFEKGEPFPKNIEALVARGKRGFSGTRGGTDPSRLLQAFLRLGYTPPRGSPLVDRVQTFVQRWGPLWLCQTPEHHAHGSRCYWEPQQARYWGGKATICTWQPVEEIAEFIWEAQYARAVVQAAGQLRAAQQLPDWQQNPHLVSRKLWEAIGVRVPGDSLEHQWRSLMHVVEDCLALHGQVKLTLRWLNPNIPPKLHLISKIGFLPVVWMEIAQLLCNAKGIYECSNCHKLYTRIQKAPKWGDNNYCDDCSVGNRGASRQLRKRQHKTPR